MALRFRIADALTRRVRARDTPAVRQLLEPAAGLRLLDVGGGTGAAAEWVAPECSVDVVEPHEAKVAHGRAARPELRFHVAGAEALPFPDGAFDRALALFAFHHFADQARALRELRRVLRPGGRVVLQEADPARGLGKRLAWFEQRVLRNGARFVRPSQLVAMLREAGFADVHTQAASRGYLALACVR